MKAVAPLLRQTVRPALSIQHPALPDYNPAIRGYEFDPTKAKDLLAQPGWTGAVTTILGQASNRFLDTFNGAVVESLRKTLGVAVNLQPVASFETLTRAARSGTAAVYMFAWQSDPHDFAYPSFALGIAHDVVSDPEARALAEKRDGEAAERLLLERVLKVPIINY